MDELGDVTLSVTGVTALDVADELSGPPATVGVGELEGPKESGGLLEVRTTGGDLVDEVLDACKGEGMNRNQGNERVRG